MPRELRSFASTSVAPERIGSLLRAPLKMSANVAHVPNTSTLPAKAGLLLSHSNTVTFGFGPNSFELIRGSAAPVAIALYPGYENHIVFVTRATLPLFWLP